MSATPLACLLFLSFTALNLRQHVERRVEFLSFILVSVEAKLVMVGGSVLPLAERLDTEKFHECADLNFRELFTQLAVTDEVPVFLNRA